MDHDDDDVLGIAKIAFIPAATVGYLGSVRGFPLVILAAIAFGVATFLAAVVLPVIAEKHDARAARRADTPSADNVPLRTRAKEWGDAVDSWSTALLRIAFVGFAVASGGTVGAVARAVKDAI